MTHNQKHTWFGPCPGIVANMRLLAPPSAERKLAEQDAGAYGVGYLVDGKRVHPSRVVVLNIKKSGDTND